MTIRTGGCQCGAVRFRAGSLLDNPHVCHCRMCQKATGGFFAALVGVPKEDLEWVRGEPAVFESSAGVERGFCRDCGTPLFYHATEGGHVSLGIATFDDAAAIPLQFEAGLSTRLPQVAQLGHLPVEDFEAERPDWAAGIRATTRQHPDHETYDDPEDFPV